MRPARSGFTLVEIMTVILVIAIVAGMVAPNLTGSGETIRLETAARRIESLMDYCYHAAVSTGRVHALTYDPRTRRIDVVYEAPPSADAVQTDPNAPPTLQPASLPGFTDRDLPAGIAISGMNLAETELAQGDDGAVRVLFFPDGTTEFALLELIAKSGERRVVRLNGLSGTVEVRDPGPVDLAAGETIGTRP